MTTNPLLHLHNVTKRYGQNAAVDDVSLELSRGEVLVVVGPSGCGKSTLLRCIAGLTGIDAGSIDLAGRQVAGPTTFVPAERRGVGIVFQDLALFPHLNVADNVGFGLTYLKNKHDQKTSAAQVASMLELVGLSDKAQRFPHELSGGEQQRVAIARALALEPDLVLLDEPFSHLDRGLSVKVRNEATAALRQAGATVVLVTHDQDEALAVGDKVAVMQDGVLVQIDTPSTVFHQPTNRFVASFLGEAIFLPGQRRSDIADTVFGELPISAGPDGDVTVMVRPHDLTVAESASAVGPTGIVTSVEFRGGSYLHEVELTPGIRVHALTPHTIRFNVGDTVAVWLSTHHPLTAFSER